VPMQKISTLPNKTDLLKKLRSLDHQQLEPNAATLKNILRFASTYRVEKVSNNQFIELFLN
jgi:hypothetical protein